MRNQRIIHQKLKKAEQNKKKKGFTLVELIVNMAIIGIIMVMITSLTSISLQSFKKQKRNLDAVDVANLILTTIENEIKFVGHAKLENYYEATPLTDSDGTFIAGEWKDINGDGKPDYNVFSSDGTQYPFNLYDLNVYSMIYLLPDNDVKTNENRNKLSNEARRGKLYRVRCDKEAVLGDAKTDGKLGYFINTKEGNPIYVEPLLDEKLYQGYSVDVKFKYLSKSKPTTNDGGISVIAEPAEPEGDGSTQVPEPVLPDSGEGGSQVPKPILPGEDVGGTHGLMNCIKVFVDVYEGSTKIYSQTGVVTFIQKFFTLDMSYGVYEDYKDVLFTRPYE